MVARKISQAVENAASAQGLAHGDYALVGFYDENTERISLTFGTDRPVDELRLYSEVFGEIRRLFPGAAQITMRIGLVIRKVRNLDEIYSEEAGAEDEVDITDLLERV